MLKYIELKSGHVDNGPAWIARVSSSKSGRTLYFNGRALKRMVRGGVRGNHLDITTGEEFWISGIKKNGEDRHWAGSGKILIQEDAVDEYLSIIGAARLDSTRYGVFKPAVTDKAKLQEPENRKWDKG